MARLTDDKWMQEASAEMEKKGTEGLFTKKAKEHGMTTVEFANEVENNPDKFDLKTRRQAQFMINANPELFAEGGKTKEKEIHPIFGEDWTNSKSKRYTMYPQSKEPVSKRKPLAVSVTGNKLSKFYDSFDGYVVESEKGEKEWISKEVKDIMKKHHNLTLKDGGGISEEWISYTGESYDPKNIQRHKTARAAKSRMTRLFNSGEYNSVGTMKAEEYDTFFKELGGKAPKGRKRKGTTVIQKKRRGRTKGSKVRPKSALMRDRKYTSDEKHEEEYSLKRKSPILKYGTFEDGGLIFDSLEKTSNGIWFDERIASINGAAFILYPSNEHTDEDINKAKREIRDQRDAISINKASDWDWDNLYKSAYFRHPEVKKLKWYQIEQDEDLIRKERKAGLSPEEFAEKHVLPNAKRVESENKKKYGKSIYEMKKGGGVGLDSISATKSHYGYSDEEWGAFEEDKKIELRRDSYKDLQRGRAVKKKKATRSRGMSKVKTSEYFDGGLSFLNW